MVGRLPQHRSLTPMQAIVCCGDEPSSSEENFSFNQVSLHSTAMLLCFYVIGVRFPYLGNIDITSAEITLRQSKNYIHVTDENTRPFLYS